MPAQMHMHRRIPFFQSGGYEHAVAHDAGIVDDDMQVAKGIQRRINNAFCCIPIGNVFIIGDRVSTRRLDFFDNGVCRRCVAAFAVERGADVIDDDVRTLRTKGERIGTPQPARRACDDYGSSVANTHYSLSIIVTLAWPPPSHMVCRP